MAGGQCHALLVAKLVYIAVLVLLYVVQAVIVYGT